MLKFSRANRKLRKLYVIRKLRKFLKDNRKIYSFDLLAGHTCPSANTCLSMVIEDNNGKRTIKDGPETLERCYAASEEVIFPALYNLHKHNTDAVKTAVSNNSIEDAISEAIPKDAGVIRIHSSGDFFHKKYFMAWLAIAKKNPNILFYGYTKHAIGWLIRNRGIIPTNFVFTASIGGKQDNLIDSKTRTARIVYSRAEARKLKLQIDEDDSHAALGKDSFALLLHGIQPKNSRAAVALEKLKYPRGRKNGRAAGY